MRMDPSAQAEVRPPQSVFERTFASAKQGLFGLLFLMAKDIAAGNSMALVRGLKKTVYFCADSTVRSGCFEQCVRG